MDMDGLIIEWKLMKAALERQQEAFNSPMPLRTFTKRRDTTQESKEHVARCILELTVLLRQHGED
jgi:hypothetical protein